MTDVHVKTRKKSTSSQPPNKKIKLKIAAKITRKRGFSLQCEQSQDDEFDHAVQLDGKA